MQGQLNNGEISDLTMGEGDVGEVSQDGRWFWDGQKWQSVISPDGKFRWSGTAWVAAASQPQSGLKPWSTKKVTAAVAGGFAGMVIIVALVAAVVGAATTPSASSHAQVARAESPAPSTAPSQSSGASAAATPSHSPSASPQSSPSPSPTPKQETSPAAPSPKPNAVASPQPPPPPPPSTCGAPANPWAYTFCGGRLIYSPPASFCNYFNCIASFWSSTNGYVVECVDGKYSHSGGVQGACSQHSGVLRPLYMP